AGALLGAFGRLLSLVFSPIVIYSALAIGAIALFRAAWENDWLGIRTAATDAWENYIQPVWERLKDRWEWAIDIAGNAWDWLTDTSWGDKVEDVRGWLDSAWDWTINLLGDAWAWIETNLPWVAATIETLHGLITAGWDWTIRKAGDAWGWLERGIPEELRELGTAVLTVVFQPFGDLYEAIKRGLETGDWSGVWGAAADVWRRGIQIAVGLTLATRTVQLVLNAIRTGLGLAATGVAAGIARLGMPGVLGALSILVALAEAREQGDYRKFGADLVAALAAGIGIGVFTGSPYAGALAFTVVLNFEIGSWIGDKLDQLRERIMLWFQDTALGRLLTRGDQAEVEIPAVLRIEQVTGLAGLSDILRAIYLAEGGPEARVPYGATGFADRGHRFMLEANQRRFEELVRSLNLVEGTEDYYAAAAAVTVQHYWDAFRREFPEVGERTFAELAPEMQ